MNKHIFSVKVVDWYLNNKRDLPWRKTIDPYPVWLSEIILQQTRVTQGLPYYYKFLEVFPNIQSLARATEQEVLSVWQGLGYYSRARNLHKCAKQVLSQHNGKFPDTYNELLKLKGIGPYTAAAIASLCFGEKVAVLDGNVFRVLSRYFGIGEDISKISSRKKFQELANDLIKDAVPGDFNQACMELGALLCKPKQPICFDCTLKETCFAYATGEQNLFPVKSKTLKIKHRFIYYLVLEQNSGLMVKKRVNEGIWEGMYDFPFVEFKSKPDEEVLLNCLTSLGIKSADLMEVSRDYKHVLTHQVLHVCFIRLKPQKKKYAALKESFNGKLKVKSLDKLAELPKPVLITRYLREAELLS